MLTLKLSRPRVVKAQALDFYILRTREGYKTKMKDSPLNTLVAQLDIRTGDLEGNRAKIIQTIQNNQQSKFPSRFVIFSEFATSGYNCGQLFENEQFVYDCEASVREIASKVGEEVAIVGSPRFASPRHKRNGEIRLHNSAYVLHRGKIVGVYDKIHLANLGQHEDRKYFYPGKNTLVMTLNDVTFGVLICEDIWRDDHDRDLLSEMKCANPGLETVFCINYSYHTYSKQAFRRELLSGQAYNNRVSIVYCNCVGLGDIVKNIICYDGASLVYNDWGHCIAELPSFTEVVKRVNLRSNTIVDEPTTPANLPTGRTRDWWIKYSSIWNASVYTARQCQEQMKVENAFVAMSGGVDSSVMAVILAKAVGPEHCVFMSMPSAYNGEGTKGSAQHTADKLGVPLKWLPIQDMLKSLTMGFTLMEQVDETREFQRGLTESIDLNSGATTAAHATLRSVLGLVACHLYKAAIYATGNHTENILSWMNFHDIGSIGLTQLIGDLSKTELYEFCEYINWFFGTNLIQPELFTFAFYTKPKSDDSIVPMAELPNSTVDPFDYYIMSGICCEIIRKRKTPAQLICDFVNKKLTEDYFPVRWVNELRRDKVSVYDSYTVEEFEKNVREAWWRSKSSVFKSAQHAPVLIHSPISRGFSRRETIINHYKPEIPKSAYFGVNMIR